MDEESTIPQFEEDNSNPQFEVTLNSGTSAVEMSTLMTFLQGEDGLFYLRVSAAFFVSFFVGVALVHSLRRLCIRTEEDGVWKLASVCYIVPVSSYIALQYAHDYNLCNRVIADSFSFGILTGIVGNLLKKPSGNDTVRLLLRTDPGKEPTNTVWLKSDKSTLAEALDAIRIHLNLGTSQVSIESGRGCFLSDMNLPLLPQLHGYKNHVLAHGKEKDVLVVDFFGFTTASCDIVIQSQ